jgi:exodeoxyribonuclease VII large subunit
VVIIRGGGAVNDLAWLNDYDLARCICETPVPVLTGIGHERDRTVLDEVAHQSFDTPSKVAAGIEQLIVKRAREAQAAHELVLQVAGRITARTRADVERSKAEVLTGARLALRQGRHQATELLQSIRHDSLLQLEQARHRVPATLAEIAALARHSLKEARTGAQQQRTLILDQASQHALLARERSQVAMDQVVEAARRQLRDARQGAEALMREIVGQGPDKTLGRGFAVARTEQGRPLADAAAARQVTKLQIQFRDGSVPVQVMNETGETAG